MMVLFISVYFLAFTPIGNSLFKPMIEQKIKVETKLDSRLTSFSLGMSDFSIVLELDRDNSIYLNGTYSLFSQVFNILYRVEMNRLENLNSLTNAPIQGVFHTQGDIKGDMAFMEVNGVSDVAKGKTTYHIELKDLNPTSIIAKVDKADLASLLYLVKQSNYASAEVNLDIDFKNIIPHALDGSILLKTKNGKVNTKLMKEDFNITLPQTAFSMDLQAKLQGDDIDYAYMLHSNLAKISSKGRVTPQPLQADIEYGVDIKELAMLRPITDAPLRGAFKTAGTIKGSKKSMLVDGKSNIGGSKTTYKVDLKEFKPQSIIATIKGAKVEKLLYMLGEPNFASSNLNADIKLTSLDPENLAGYMDIKLSKGLVNSKIMKKIYDVTIPKTTFNSTTHVKLKAKDVDYEIAFNSNLAKLNSAGHIVPESMAMDLKYDLNVKELAVLKPITGADIRGAFRLDGRIKGDKSKLIVDGRSDFASSDTQFDMLLKDFELASLKAKIQNLHLAKVLYMLKQPHYSDGLFSLDADITDARGSKLKGKISSNIKNGLLDSNYMTKTYEFKTKMPQTKFRMNTYTTLDGDIADTKVELDSTLANFKIKRARFNIVDSSLKSDYKIDIPSLDKLFFATDRHIRGGIVMDGELDKDKDLDLTMHTDVAGGKIDANLHNDDLHADIISIQTLDALNMLIYPEIIRSNLDGTLDYNLLKEKGVFRAKLRDGKFSKNQIFGLLKKYSKIDLYKETFQGNIDAKIHKEKIVTALDLTSRTSSITTKNTKLNSKTKMIDSTIRVVANKHPVTVRLRGDVSSPKVDVDLQKLIESKTGDAIKKKASKLLDKLFK